MNHIKKLFFSLSCVYLGINYSLSSDLSSLQIEDLLTNNVYRVTSVPYSIPLTGDIREISEPDGTKKLEEEVTSSKFTHAFSFIKKEQGKEKKDENSFFIVHIADENLLSYVSSKASQPLKPTYKGQESSEHKDFLWNVDVISHKPSLIVTIKPLNGDKFLAFKKTEKKDGIKGTISTKYSLVFEDKLEKQPSGSSFFSFPESNNSQWRLSPFYPSSGYSDFFRIILDAGELIARRHGTELVHVKTAPTSSHDRAFLSVNCLEKTRLGILSPSQKRKIFSINDDFDSTIQGRAGSSVKITRAIETEQIFQTTIENCLSRSKKESKTTSVKDSHIQVQSRGKESEIMDQEGFSESLNTLLSVSIAHKIDHSSGTAQRSSEERSSSTGQSSHFDSSRGQSEGESESEGSEFNVSSNASLSVPGFGGGGMGVSAGKKSGKEINKSTTSSSSTGRNVSSQDGRSSVSEKSIDKTTIIGKGKEEGKQEGKTKNQDSVHQNKDLRSDSSSEEWSRGSDKLQEFGLEESLSLSEVRSVTKKKNEKWFIERELHQTPGTSLQVTFFEEIFQVTDYPFAAYLKISGYVGFRFKSSILIAHNPFTDYRENGFWYLSPVTILKYIKAPGYKESEKGSIDYIVRGKITLKQPLNIFTVIKETPRV